MQACRAIHTCSKINRIEIDTISLKGIISEVYVFYSPYTNVKADAHMHTHTYSLAEKYMQRSARHGAFNVTMTTCRAS